MRKVSSSRSLLLAAALVLIGGTLAAQTNPQQPAPPQPAGQPSPEELKAKLNDALKLLEGKELPDDVKAKLDAVMRRMQEKAGAVKPAEGKPIVITPAEGKPAEGKPPVIPPAEGK